MLLTEVADRVSGNYSGGMQRRLSLAIALPGTQKLSLWTSLRLGWTLLQGEMFGIVSVKRKGARHRSHNSRDGRSRHIGRQNCGNVGRPYSGDRKFASFEKEVWELIPTEPLVDKEAAPTAPSTKSRASWKTRSSRTPTTAMCTA